MSGRQRNKRVARRSSASTPTSTIRNIQAPATIGSAEPAISEPIFGVVHSSWSGPLPPPSVLQGYDNIVQGGAERLFTLVEKQQKHAEEFENREQIHRHEMDRRLIVHEEKRRWLSVLATTISLGMAVGSVLIGAHPIVSVALAGLPMASVIHNAIKRWGI